MKFKSEDGPVFDQVANQIHRIECEHYNPKLLVTVTPRGWRELAHSVPMYYGHLFHEDQIGRHRIVEVHGQDDDIMIWKLAYGD